MHRTRVLGLVGWVSACALVAACSANSGPDSTGSGANGGSSAASGSGATGGMLVGGTGGGGNNGGTGNIGGFVGSSGSGSGGGPQRDACAASSHRGEQIPLDMYIMFDQSGSMDQEAGNTSRWNAVKDALTTFVQSPESAAIGIGIQYFPLGVAAVDCNAMPTPPECTCIDLVIFRFCFQSGGMSSCTLADYEAPDVPIQELPGAAQGIVASLNNHTPRGGTPTRPALEGAINYASSHAASNPGRKTIVVLATDGAPNDCNSNVGNVAEVAAAGFGRNPSIQTYVVGVGNVGNLNQIAQAGGTNQAFIVSDANAGQEFLRAMNQIRGQALSCDFNIPLPDNRPPNYSQVNVLFTPSGGGGQIVYKVNTAAECRADQPGWYYDDNANPTLIKLCPSACDTITNNPGQVDIETGCDSIPIPPA